MNENKTVTFADLGKIYTIKHTSLESDSSITGFTGNRYYLDTDDEETSKVIQMLELNIPVMVRLFRSPNVVWLLIPSINLMLYVASNAVRANFFTGSSQLDVHTSDGIICNAQYV
jgi:hypothetical protein